MTEIGQHLSGALLSHLRPIRAKIGHLVPDWTDPFFPFAASRRDISRIARQHLFEPTQSEGEMTSWGAKLKDSDSQPVLLQSWYVPYARVHSAARSYQYIGTCTYSTSSGSFSASFALLTVSS